MPRTIKLKTSVPWEEIRVTDADWLKADVTTMVRMLHNLNLIRAFEETVLELAGENLVHGPAHSSIGQEGAAVGAMAAVRTGDQINGTHRAHHQFLERWGRECKQSFNVLWLRSWGLSRVTAGAAVVRCIFVHVNLA